MRRPLTIVTVTAAVLAAGLLAVPAVAATSTALTGTATCPRDGTAGGMRDGTGAGMGRMGQGAVRGKGPGNGAGTGRRDSTVSDPLAGLARGTMTADQKSALAGMAEEEKLARDVYVALAKTSGDARFTRIATAEARHLTEVRALLTRYGVTDPTAGKSDGAFATASVQQQYTGLVARGSASPAAALAVGRDVENADIADLAKAATGVTAPDVTTVYTRLTNGSRRHLRAFGG